MTPHPTLDLSSDSVFEHVRSSDKELVGYIAMTAEGDFIPYDLLHRPAGPAGDLGQAEQLLESTGLTLLAETYELRREGRRVRVGIKELTRDEVTVGPLSGDVDPSRDPVDLTARWTYPLPTEELRPLGREESRLQPAYAPTGRRESVTTRAT